MKKKLVSLLTALTMLAALFAGCGTTGSSRQGAASASSQPQEETSQAAPTQAPEPASTPEEASSSEASAAETLSDRPEVTYPLVEEETTLT